MIINAGRFVGPAVVCMLGGRTAGSCGCGHWIRDSGRRHSVPQAAGQHWRAAVQRVRSVDLDRRTHAFEHIPALAVRGCPPTQWLVNGEQVTHANAGCVVSRRRLAERPLFRSANLRDRPRGAIRACNLGRLKRISRKLATAEQAFMELGTLARRLLWGTLRLACGSERYPAPVVPREGDVTCRREPAAGAWSTSGSRRHPSVHCTERFTMKCPVCPDATLMMADRQGVEIDYCPNCRGVWLDRGELDKLVALGAKHDVAHAPTSPSAEPRERRDFEDSDFGKRHSGYRRRSWLSDIFD